MPYVNKAARLHFSDFDPPAAGNAGELNYLVTLVIAKYIETNGLNYQHCNDVVGALDGAKAEFQRRVVAPYEDSKIRENGDVYPPRLLGGT